MLTIAEFMNLHKLDYEDAVDSFVQCITMQNADFFTKCMSALRDNCDNNDIAIIQEVFEFGDCDSCTRIDLENYEPEYDPNG